MWWDKTKAPLVEGRAQKCVLTELKLMSCLSARLFGGLCRNVKDSKTNKQTKKQKDEWEEHDSNGNPVLESECVHFHGVVQSRLKIPPNRKYQESFFLIIVHKNNKKAVVLIWLTTSLNAKDPKHQRGSVCMSTLAVPNFQRSNFNESKVEIV